MLMLEKICVTLGKKTPLERRILNDLNLTVHAGEFIVIIGGNGAGKSTLLNVISGLTIPESGKITLGSVDITRQTNRSNLVAKVMQDPRVGTIKDLTIFENMALSLKRGQKRTLTPCFSGVRKQLFYDKLAALGMGLEKRLNEIAGNLSGGQRQALSLVMALLADSKILLLDEITAALDPGSAEIVAELANRIVRQENRTCIMVTHNMAQAIKYGDRTLILRDGRFTREFTDKANLTPTDLAAILNDN